MRPEQRDRKVHDTLRLQSVFGFPHRPWNPSLDHSPLFPANNDRGFQLPAGRYKLDMSGPGFHADIDDVARGLLAVLDRCELTKEPTFRDWRGTERSW